MHPATQALLLAGAVLAVHMLIRVWRAQSSRDRRDELAPPPLEPRARFCICGHPHASHYFAGEPNTGGRCHYCDCPRFEEAA